MTVSVDLSGPRPADDGAGHTGPLRIAMVAPPWADIPPAGYGGIEAVLYDLVGGLDRLGHHVTLIGAGRTAAGVPFLRTYERAPSERIGEPMPEALHTAMASRLLEGLEVDVVHDHTLCGPLTAAGRAVPTVATCHGTVDGELGAYYRAVGGAVSLVSISLAQRIFAPDLNWAGQVYNAVDTRTYPFRERKEDWVLWVGRFSADKGAHLAIDAARAAGRRIVLAGKLVEPSEHAYFEQYVRPRLGPDARYEGEADRARKAELMADARCLVFPITWHEPFGMVMIEAMACGTPVVALGRGSVPEVVADGVTGFIRRAPSELPAAIEEVGRLRPRDSRAHVERCFDAAAMAAGYERVYRGVIAHTAAARATAARAAARHSLRSL
ncbi:glycosyltransferase family 4 protein [Sphaerisporangium sp. TRM90804]|uniref:glycosyltransferase family 4 protein n=1 Tax=Sphaerisporangium sp. TRM90804 TaxID=3031113 RepID=UPI00244AFA06|nr:glycosyltransferase family 4 protein [Sphaerisporangium sp. TRM90804]MDH2427670.1 glycosyltransferase family 4 protein [Sphaerisporangium sp. TRM90804]